MDIFFSQLRRSCNFILQPADKKVLEQIANNSAVTMAKIGELTGLSESAIYNAIKKLTADGIIARVGARKKGSWIIVNNK